MELINVLRNTAISLLWADQVEKGERYWAEAHRLARTLEDVTALRNLALTLDREGCVEDADTTWEEARSLSRKVEEEARALLRDV